MSAPEMVCHLNSALRQALGELETRPPRGWVRFWPMNKLAIHLIPWPKGKTKAPREFLERKPESWDADRRELTTLLDRIAKRGAGGEWPRHPVFGRISGRDWGVLSWRHVDHHLRQFGAALLIAFLSMACAAEKPAAAPVEPKIGNPDRGKQLIAQNGCPACHVIPGIEAAGSLGPSLAAMSTRPVIGDGKIPNTPENVAKYVQNPAALYPDASMPSLDMPEADARDITAYLFTLK